ncbi:MAG: ATP-binding protein [Bacteroidia bacterium]|nr:ATP-binding protein [Bacteroidia bacterium]
MEEKNKRIIRIAFIGPESTAKSTLSEQLANYYQTVWVKEYAREYIQQLNSKYCLNDIVEISKKQLQAEDELIKNANRFIFVDTEWINAKVWCLDVFKTCPDFILNNAISPKYDLYLLTYHDIPWKEDAVRENPNRRNFFFQWYERELKQINANYQIIKGENEVRFLNCIHAIENFCGSIKK